MVERGELPDMDVGRILVAVARRSLELFVREQVRFKPDLAELTTAVSQPGCSFVTLTNHGKLRGCIGSTEPRWSLAEDVARHAAAASRDHRFAPVKPVELPDIRLEVTILTPPVDLVYANYDDLLRKLRPGKDGVILTGRLNRGVLLPQVWQRIPKPAQFLAVLARKADISVEELMADSPTIKVQTFQVQHYEEPGYRGPGS